MLGRWRGMKAWSVSDSARQVNCRCFKRKRTLFLQCFFLSPFAKSFLKGIKLEISLLALQSLAASVACLLKTEHTGQNVQHGPPTVSRSSFFTLSDMRQGEKKVCFSVDENIANIKAFQVSLLSKALLLFPCQ